ncbi:hypothetical protein M2160_002837 [Streptomyces sp. SAI-117]|uniref:S8 family serine peptidase n=1 Tax=Streptomyces sp. SAI-117 TaxID=2940546 RepID=UPI002476CF71|nr:S8 family serine peptidase [Streptomyces sp. SAI-117]MDH6567816.1 hypothetical protein [Streptomyces sp. SAI-117]
MPDELDARLPKILFAQASPRSVGGRSLFEAGAVTTAGAEDFTSEEQVASAAERQLADAGFQILQRSPQTLNIAGPPALYQQFFGTRLVAEERPVIKPGGRETTATFIDARETDLPGLISTAGTPVADTVEGVAIEEPVYAFQNATPPKVNYWHLEVPDQVASLLGANRAHQRGFRGNGVRLTMVDTGWFRHPYFAARNLNGTVVLGPGAVQPAVDENGHGTGESANAFALAPGMDFSMVKANFANILGAFNTAVARTPAAQIISNSWGYSVMDPPLSAIQQALAASVALASAGGVIVVFSAGNGHWGFPAQHPAVIAAGGVYIDQLGNARASDYASGFASRLYPGRNVPDLSGLVGLRPRAAYIMLPVPPGCAIDRDLGNGLPFPDGDETSPTDGWAAFSGTSAAAPQIAGICALIRQAHPGLGLRGVRNALTRTAKDVTSGVSSPSTGGQAAGPGFDLATGWGLADAQAAVHAAIPAAASPAAYARGDDRHVFHRGTDTFLREWWWSPALGWRFGDLSTVALGVPAAGSPAAYLLGDSQHVVFRGTDARVHELWWSPGSGGWRRGALDAAAQGIPAAGDARGYVLGDSQHVVFRGADGRVHEVWWSAATGWQIGGTSSVAQAVPAGGDPFGYVLGDSQHVVYRGTDDRVHELWWSALTGWRRGALDAAAQGIPAAGDARGYVLGDSQHVVFRGADGRVHEVWWSAATGWQIGGTSSVAQAVPAGGDPFGYVLGDSQHVVYRGTDDRVHELWWSPGSGGWRRGDLDAAAQGIPVAGDPTAYTVAGEQRVVFRGTDGLLHELCWAAARGWFVGEL